MSKIGMMSAFLIMGDLESSEKPLKEKVAYKERIVFATMRNSIPDWQPPSDWETITDEDKMSRLTKIQEML
jgi:hypothetical protein